ncbi:putative ATPase [Kribbella sp. VKM Ac-2571]|uniref:BTAD domain-containing putative transcriptional regulator n=1 Tax=Kribbella sp. VKM Ac-2571 TaxID=2512222 RepID=UPI00105B325E|nr:BTAD domain-containing putative transcriptional regulator [Kribbella sp. VKM Ac-2571]TDO66440.1 putative ATPase [Kribbella sp. VKM Ac-2571]
MRFGVLGTVTAWTGDGRAVRFPDRKVRALLADLLLHTGRPVAAATLIDDLWGDELPVNPTATLQTRVSQLRRALDEAEPGARKLIRTSPPGYLIDVAPEALDSGLFRALAARARQTGSARMRAATLADALTLWRGPAYAEVAADPFARAAVDRLDEERLAVQEAYAETRLVLGEYEDLVAELAELVAHNPLRQRLRAVQMRALHETGRQAEALESYADLRDRLRVELGLDPSAELVALRQSILTEEPAPRARSDSNLPAAVTELIGRNVDEVVSLLDSARLVTLTGPGGVGKTSLALEAARRMPDARLVELAALDSDQVAAAVDPAPGLLVLDNCEHVIEAAAAVVAQLLRDAPELRILATSREALAIAGEHRLAVPPLDEPTSLRLFVTRARAVDPRFELTPDNREAVVALCRRLDGLPLALELAAGRAGAMDVRDLAERFDDRYRQRGVPGRQQTVSAMIEWSWDLLSEREQAVLRRLAPHPGGCTLAAAEAVCTGDDVPLTEVAELLSRLVDRSLVVRVDGTSGSRYRLLETVRAFCQQRLAEAGEGESVRRRYEQYFERLAQHTEPRLYGHSELFAYLGGLYGEEPPAKPLPSATRRLETVVSADGTPIAVEVYGAGSPAIVLVGGALNDRRAFVPLAKWLASRFTVATYDRRRRGGSGDVQPWAVERELEDLAAVVELVGGTAYALGVSSGAVLAAEAAAAGVPISGLILIEPPFIIDGTRPVPLELAGRLRQLIAHDRYGDATELFLVTAVEMPPEVVAPMRSAPLWKDLEALAPTLVYDVLLMGDFSIPAHWDGGITVPAVVIDGGQSQAWRRNTAQAVAELLPQGRRLTMAGQPHDALPEVLGPIVQDFIGR